MCRIGGRTNGYIRKGLSFSNILPDDPLNDVTGEKVFTRSFTILCETWTFYLIIRQQMAKINDHLPKERLSTNSLNVLDIQPFLLIIHGKLEILKEIAIAQKELPN